MKDLTWGKMKGFDDKYSFSGNGSLEELFDDIYTKPTILELLDQNASYIKVM